MSYEKKTGRDTSSRRFVQKIGEVTFFFVGGVTQVYKNRDVDITALRYNTDRYITVYCYTLNMKVWCKCRSV